MRRALECGSSGLRVWGLGSGVWEVGVLAWRFRVWGVGLPVPSGIRAALLRVHAQTLTRGPKHQPPNRRQPWSARMPCQLGIEFKIHVCIFTDICIERERDRGKDTKREREKKREKPKPQHQIQTRHYTQKHTQGAGAPVISSIVVEESWTFRDDGHCSNFHQECFTCALWQFQKEESIRLRWAPYIPTLDPKS